MPLPPPPIYLLLLLLLLLGDSESKVLFGISALADEDKRGTRLIKQVLKQLQAQSFDPPARVDQYWCSQPTSQPSCQHFATHHGTDVLNTVPESQRVGLRRDVAKERGVDELESSRMCCA
jgi:hypothetical protein